MNPNTGVAAVKFLAAKDIDRMLAQTPSPLLRDFLLDLRNGERFRPYCEESPS